MKIRNDGFGLKTREADRRNLVMMSLFDQHSG
jgi:hypothetical protein